MQKKEKLSKLEIALRKNLRKRKIQKRKNQNNDIKRQTN